MHFSELGDEFVIAIMKNSPHPVLSDDPARSMTNPDTEVYPANAQNN